MTARANMPASNVNDFTKDVTDIINAMQNEPGALLPILHAVQRKLGYIPAESLPLLAERLNLSRAEIHGVISFYHDFCTEPGGAHTVQICRAEACQAMGSRALEAHAKLALGIGFGATTEDGRVTLEPVYCLGNCACAPSIRIDDRVHARVDNQRFDQLMNALDKSGEIK